MATFKSFVLVALLALTRGIEGESIRGPSGSEERMATIDRAKESFDVVSQFLNDVEMNDENVGKIERIAVKMKDMGPMLTEMRDAMFEEDADADQWRAFDNVNDRYGSLMGAIDDKLEESVAFVEEKKEDERERLETLNNVNESVDAVSAFLDNVEITEDSIGNIKAVAEGASVLGPLLEKMNDEMSDGDANMDQWDAYRSTLTRYQSLMKSVNEKLESSYEFLDGLENSSGEEEEEGEIDGKGLVEALRFANEALDNADGMEDMEEVEDVLDYVNNSLDGMNGKVKSKFEELTEALSMKLNEKRSSFEVADSDSDERVAALDKVNTSLDDVSQFLDDVEMDEESIEEIKKVAATMDKMGSVLTGMRDEMSEGDADQSRVYGSTLDKFSSVMEAVADKLEESVAYAEAENESSDEEVDSADLVDVLNYAKAAIDGATFKDDLVAAKDALRYVDGKLKGVDEEMKSKLEEETGSLYMLLNEKSVSFEEDEKY